MSPHPPWFCFPLLLAILGLDGSRTIVVTHVRERSDDTGASSVSSGSRLRGVSDCSESDALALDAPSPSPSELSASVATIHSASGAPAAVCCACACFINIADAAAPLAVVSECPLAVCIAGARMGGDGHTRYFEFRCVFGDLSPWNSYKRYSECLKLSDKIRADPCAPNFPPKHGDFRVYLLMKRSSLHEKKSGSRRSSHGLTFTLSRAPRSRIMENFFRFLMLGGSRSCKGVRGRAKRGLVLLLM